VDKKIIRVNLTDIRFESSDKFSFALSNSHGKEVRVPYHRIKRVWRMDELVWKREVR